MDDAEQEEMENSNSELGKLIQVAKRLENRPKIDDSLSNVLDEFMVKLKEHGRLLSHGICLLNFSEAAILLQTSAFVYRKNVDLLWENVNECQKRLVSLKLNNENIEGLSHLEEREIKHKHQRARQKIIEIPQRNDNFHVNFDKITDFEHTNFSTDDNIFQNWTNGPNLNISNCDEKNCNFDTPRFKIDAIFEDDEDEFIAHTSNLESVRGLDNLILNPNGRKMPDFYIELISELYLLPKFMSLNKLSVEDMEKHRIDFEKYINNFKEVYEKNQSIKANSTALSVDKFQLECKVKICRLSIDDMNKLRGISHDEKANFKDENEATNCESCVEINKNNNVQTSDKSTENSDENAPLNHVNSSKNALDDSHNPEDLIHLIKLEKRRREDSEDWLEFPMKRRKISKKAFAKLASGITVDCAEFNKFFSANYTPEEDEGIIPDEIEESHSTLDMSLDSGFESSFSESVSDESCREVEITTCKEAPQRQDSSSQNQNVLDWKQFMNTKLKSIKSSDFDVREYSTKIVQELTNCERKEEKFGHLMCGKNSSEVSRFFMSALFLANSSNVEIFGVKSGELSNDNLRLKLINKNLNFDSLELENSANFKRSSSATSGLSSKRTKF